MITYFLKSLLVKDLRNNEIGETVAAAVLCS